MGKEIQHKYLQSARELRIQAAAEIRERIKSGDIVRLDKNVFPDDPDERKKLLAKERKSILKEYKKTDSYKELKNVNRSRAGLFTALVNNGHIDASEHISANGRIRTEVLAGSEYFRNNPDKIAALRNYQLSKLSKTRKAAAAIKEGTQSAKDETKKTSDEDFTENKPVLERLESQKFKTIIPEYIAPKAAENEEIFYEDNPQKDIVIYPHKNGIGKYFSELWTKKQGKKERHKKRAEIATTILLGATLLNPTPIGLSNKSAKQEGVYRLYTTNYLTGITLNNGQGKVNYNRPPYSLGVKFPEYLDPLPGMKEIDPVTTSELQRGESNDKLTDSIINGLTNFGSQAAKTETPKNQEGERPGSEESKNHQFLEREETWNNLAGDWKGRIVKHNYGTLDKAERNELGLWIEKTNNGANFKLNFKNGKESGADRVKQGFGFVAFGDPKQEPNKLAVWMVPESGKMPLDLDNWEKEIEIVNPDGTTRMVKGGHLANLGMEKYKSGMLEFLANVHGGFVETKTNDKGETTIQKLHILASKFSEEVLKKLAKGKYKIPKNKTGFTLVKK
jgi:hypothetical protein